MAKKRNDRKAQRRIEAEERIALENKRRARQAEERRVWIAKNQREIDRLEKAQARGLD